jgi:hypothetical protein
MSKICSELTKSTNVTLELRYWHNNLKSFKSLIELLETYLELSMLETIVKL